MSGGAGLLQSYESMNNELMTQHNKVELRKSINIP